MGTYTTRQVRPASSWARSVFLTSIGTEIRASKTLVTARVAYLWKEKRALKTVEPYVTHLPAMHLLLFTTRQVILARRISADARTTNTSTVRSASKIHAVALEGRRSMAKIAREKEP